VINDPCNSPTPFFWGAICKGWRELAWSTPELWTRLAFTLNDFKKSRHMDAFVSEWLDRSGGLPLTLKIHHVTYVPYTLASGIHDPVIAALNRHSGRWYDVNFKLPSHCFHLLCGTSRPKNLCNLAISNSSMTGKIRPIYPRFRMNTRPSPMKFEISRFLLENLAWDISWDKLVNLNLKHTCLAGVLQVIRDAPLLEICSLTFIRLPTDGFPTPKTIIRHPQLRTLELLSIENEVFTMLINSMELPSLESWQVSSAAMPVDTMISFLKRSDCGLKTLGLKHDQWRHNAPMLSVEDFETLLQALPHIQHLSIDCLRYVFPSVMDHILEQMSTSPPALHPSNNAGLLSDLQSLDINGRDLTVWECIPLIFGWPHRASLSLKIKVDKININDEVSGELVQLVDQGTKLSIHSDHGRHDYLQIFRDRATVEST
jgi:hypothetical protein